MKKTSLVVLGILLASCSKPTVDSSHSNQKWAIAIAEHRAKEEGYDLSRYGPAKAVQYEKNGKVVWGISYVLKGDPQPGDHFAIAVEEGSGASRIILGR